MNYGLWTILIPFLQFALLIRILLLPIFTKQQQKSPRWNDNLDQIVEDVKMLEKVTQLQQLKEEEQLFQSEQHKEEEKQEKKISGQEDNSCSNIIERISEQQNYISSINETIPQDNFQIQFEQSVSNQNLKTEISDAKIVFPKDQNINEQELTANNLSNISHLNERSYTEENENEREQSNLNSNSKIVHSYSNSYQIRDLNQSFEQVEQNQFSLQRILEIIDEVPLLVMKKYEEFIRINRVQRRKLIYVDVSLFQDNDAQLYINLLKNLFRFHDNLIRKGQKYYIYKNKLDYVKFMKQFNKYLMDPLCSNEILSHQRFALKQIRYSLQNNHTLLQYQVLEVYQILIHMMSNPNEILNKICLQFHQQSEQLYVASVLQYYLEDYIFKQKGIEDEDFQRFLNIYHNNNDIINMQYNLDEKINSYLYKQQWLETNQF